MRHKLTILTAILALSAMSGCSYLNEGSAKLQVVGKHINRVVDPLVRETSLINVMSRMAHDKSCIDIHGQPSGCTDAEIGCTDDCLEPEEGR